MMSPTHTLLALALFTKKDRPIRNWSVFIGSIIPDSFIYVAWIILTFLMGYEQSTIWNEVYFDRPMQTLAAVFNSVPIYLCLGILGWHFRTKIWGMALMFFALAALSHIALDFPVHNHDAYAHFWPISDWRFYSPISYYETHLYGLWVGTLDAMIAVISALFLWRRFEQYWVRLLLVFSILMYVAATLARWGVLSLG